MSSAVAIGPSFDRLVARCAVGAIIAYRRWISPYKGFRCAHEYVHGEGTCSSFGLQAFRANGFREARQMLSERFRECKAAAMQVHQEEDHRPRDEKKKKAGSDYCGPLDALDCGLSAVSIRSCSSGSDKGGCSKFSACDDIASCTP